MFSKDEALSACSKTESETPQADGLFEMIYRNMKRKRRRCKSSVKERRKATSIN
jgi:hypothetical protein